MFLEQGKTGIEGFFKTLFPGGQEDLLTGPDGQTLVYRYLIPKETLNPWKGWNPGPGGDLLERLQTRPKSGNR